MSLVVSPKTGKLIKTSGKAYAELLKDEKYRDFLLNPSAQEVVEGKVTPSGSPPFNNLPPLKNMTTLSPIEKVSPPSTNLPPLPPLSPRKVSQLPPLPNSPVRAYLPPSPSISLEGISMPSLPPLPVPTSNGSLPVLKIPIKASPSLKIAGKLEKSPKLKLPKLSKTKQKQKDEIEEILSMPFYDIPTLEETLKNTKQPAKRAKLEKMIKEKKYLEGRGIKTRGWDARAPTRGKERHQLHDECGDKCFLLPESEKFPICASPRMTRGKSVCAIDCGGVLSAKVRANQWGYDEVAKKAEIIIEKCNQDGLKHYVPKKTLKELPPLSPRLSPSAMMGGKMDQDDCGCGN